MTERRKDREPPTFQGLLFRYGVLLLGATLLVALTLLSLFVYQEHAHQRQARLESVAQQIQEEFRGLQRQALAEARYLSDRPDVARLLNEPGTAARQRLDRILSRHLHVTSLDHVIITNPQGQIITERPRPRRAGQPSGDMPLDLRVVTRRALSGLPSMSIGQDVEAIDLVGAVPVFLPDSDYQVVGVVAAEFHIDDRYLQRIKERIGNDISLVVDGTRKYSTLPFAEHNRLVDVPLEQRYQEALAGTDQPPTVVTGHVTAGTREYSSVFMPLLGHDETRAALGVELLENVEVLQSQIAHLLVGFTVATLILFGISTAFGRRIAARITRPISSVTAALDQLRRGNYPVVQPESMTVELSTLSQTARDLSAALEESREQTQRDLAAKELAAKRLLEEKERIHVTLESIADGVITTDPDGHITYLNPAAAELTGWSNSAAQGRLLCEVFNIVHEDSRETVEDPVARCLSEHPVSGVTTQVVLIRRDGKEFAVQESVAPIRDHSGQVLGIVLAFHDVSTARALALEISYHASHDILTGLANRREFETRLNEALGVAQREDAKHAVCYLDLDQFKLVNDTCGHVAGDELLKQLAKLLQAQIRDNDLLARLGGDEFGILLHGCPLDIAQDIAEQLRTSIREFRFRWDQRLFEVSASIGLVPIDRDSGSLSEVLSAADAACYVAKELGRNRIHLYTADDQELRRRKGEMQWVARINRAFAEERFELHCQLIQPLTMVRHRPTYHEILIRMRDEDGALVSPMVFLPAAERYNLMPTIDRWVVRTTLSLLKEGCTVLDKEEARVTINLSGQSLSDATFLDFLTQEIDGSGVAPQRLCFEITETAAIANLTDAVRLITSIRERGCRFALDDFGSGLSSFAYLKNLQVDYLKISGDFVHDIVEDAIDLSMVQSINQIGHIMGIETVAESAENEAIIAKLRDIGVDYGQGWGLERPKPLRADIEHQHAAAETKATVGRR